MGKDVQIRRDAPDSEEAESDITRAEWFHAVSRDTSLQLSRNVIVENAAGERVSLHEDTLTVWLDWPERMEGRAESLLWYSEGKVYAKDPDRATLAKMHAIAGTLKARVQGPEGEIYGADGRRHDAPKPRPWWKLW